MSGPPITKEEIEKAILSMKNHKAPGPDDIYAEVIKLMNETVPVSYSDTTVQQHISLRWIATRMDQLSIYHYPQEFPSNNLWPL